MSTETLTYQPSLPELCPVADAVSALSVSNVEERGAVYTRREVVDFILDLSGYTSDLPLYKLRLLEPSFGEGDFLLPIIERLLASCKQFSNNEDIYLTLSNSLRAIELHADSYASTSKLVLGLLEKYGIASKAANSLLKNWLIQGDFLLYHDDQNFDFVVGNPPYVRQERIPDALVTEYRRRFTTLFDRADLYIPFIEHSLNLLNEAGSLGIICSDRWMKNKYGGPLRAKISEGFHLKTYVDMVDTDAFTSDVIAYPAITIISKENSGNTKIAHKPKIDQRTLSKLSQQLLEKTAPTENSKIKQVSGIVSGSSPWILESSHELDIVRRLESTLPTLEEVGCKVGIGVATGADKAFIGSFDELDVEPDRKLRLARTQDILSGHIDWQGYGVINPFGRDGGLVDLQDYPKLKSYFEDRKHIIAGRHIAKKSPSRWYRTIDKIYPELANKEKLLIPDIKGNAHIVFEAGELYPHHNLYHITANDWDLQALQTVLVSGIAHLFVSIYSTKMRGGYLRFQAQYLRRIRIPSWEGIPNQLRQQLKQAAVNRDLSLGNEAVYELFDLNAKERKALKSNNIWNERQG